MENYKLRFINYTNKKMSEQKHMTSSFIEEDNDQMKNDAVANSEETGANKTGVGNDVNIFIFYFYF